MSADVKVERHPGVGIGKMLDLVRSDEARLLIREKAAKRMRLPVLVPVIDDRTNVSRSNDRRIVR